MERNEATEGLPGDDAAPHVERVQHPEDVGDEVTERHRPVALGRHPSRFSGICLVSTPLRLDERTTSAVVDGALADYPATVRTFVQTALPEPDTEHLRPWAEELFLTTRPDAAVELFRAATGTPVPDVSGLGVAAAIVHGTADVVVPVTAAHELADRLPGAQVSILEGAGHVPSITRPREIAAAVRGLL